MESYRLQIRGRKKVKKIARRKKKKIEKLRKRNKRDENNWRAVEK